MTEESSGEPLETPIETGVRMQQHMADPDVRDEHDADVAVGDIDQYVARTNPDSLPEAEQELENWEIPTDPLDGPIDVPPGTPLVSVFSAQSEAEANIVSGVLTAAGIPSTLQNLGIPVGGLFMSGEGEVAHVLVPATFAESARTAIADATATAVDEEQ